MLSPELELHSQLPPRLPTSSLIGERLGHFRIERELGRGAMGSVYLGRHELIGSRVAIKVIHPEVAQSAELVQRFYAEARAVNLIGHPNIVAIFDVGVLPPDRPYLVMELLEGCPLASRLGAPFDPGVLAAVLAEVLAALEAAHAHGVLHRDLKPDNIFLIDRPGARTPGVKLLDFGVAKLFGPSRSGEAALEQTGSGLVMGTPAFMAPEQWVNGELDARTDLYGLGVTAWRALVGRLPFRGKTLTDMLLAHRAHGVAAPHELNPAIPEALSLVVMRAMARHPRERFQSAAEMRAALLPLLADSGPKVRLLDGAGAELGEVAFSELTRGGVLLHSKPPWPALLTSVSLELPCPSGPLKVGARVVRHVTQAEARRWRSHPGVGVQFLGMDEVARGRLREWLSSGAAETGATVEVSPGDHGGRVDAGVGGGAGGAAGGEAGGGGGGGGAVVGAGGSGAARPGAAGVGAAGLAGGAGAFVRAGGSGAISSGAAARAGGAGALVRAGGSGDSAGSGGEAGGVGAGFGFGGSGDPFRSGGEIGGVGAGDSGGRAALEVASGYGSGAGGAAAASASAGTGAGVGSWRGAGSGTAAPAGQRDAKPQPPPLPRQAQRPPPLPSPTAVVGPPASVRAGAAGRDSPDWAERLQQVLEVWADRGDRRSHYEWLKVPLNADFERIRAAADSAQQELGKAMPAGSITETQAKQLAGAVRRLQEATAALLDPRQRALYDAELGNYQGVARCVRAGLSPEELKKLRAVWMEAKPRELDAMELELRTADLLVKRGELASACRHYVRALKQDPLNPLLYGRLRKTLLAWRGGHL